jgi:hypothetical protein
MITLELSVEDTNTVLNALAQLPYAQVAKLVNDISVAAASQLEAQQAAEASADEHTYE